MKYENNNKSWLRWIYPHEQHRREKLYVTQQIQKNNKNLSTNSQ